MNSVDEAQGLKQLQVLRLDGTGVTDAGLGTLRGLNQLADLGLGHTQITDLGLEELKGLKQLRILSDRAQIT